MGNLHINCTNCTGEIPVDDINLDRLIAKCRSCNTVFSFANQVETPVLHKAAPALHSGERPEVPMPKSLSIDRTGKSIKMTLSWYNVSVLFLASFCLFWDGFMVMWYLIALTQGEIIMALFGTIHAMIGLGMTYYCIACCFNTTVIELDGAYFRITHGPVPWWGNKELPLSKVKQLYTTERVTRGKHGPNYTYKLNAIMSNGEKEELMSGLSEVEQALFLEQEAERFLGIDDQPVPGEVPRY